MRENIGIYRGQIRRAGEKVNLKGKKLPSRWAYGGLFPGSGDYSIIYGGSSQEDIERNLVYSETVGEYTGLNDKNGTRIFEYDILKLYDAHTNYTWFAIVVFGNPHGRYTWGWELAPLDKCEANTDILCWIEMEESGAYCEVVGNIFDNPEFFGRINNG